MSAAKIDSDDALADLVARLVNEPLLAIDTEFERRSTYYPKLALVQVANPESVWLIDPLAISDWTPLRTLLPDSSSVKVLHSASEDIEVLRYATGAIPEPLFDTQIACAFLGEGPSLGYATLLQKLVGIELDKSQTRSDWMQRPLTDKQIHYAEQDVVWLPEIHDRLAARLEQAGKLEWFREECRMVVERGRDEPDPVQSVSRFRMRGQWDGKKLARLQALSTWRECTARKEDRPRTWILPDATVIAFAERVPENAAAIARCDGVHPRIVRKHGEAIIELLRTAETSAGFAKPAMAAADSGDRDRIKRLQLRIGKLADELGLDASRLARRADLERWVASPQHAHDSRLLEGWRGDLLKPVLAEEGL